MLKHFLYIYKAIKIVITSLKLKAFKNNFYICKSYYKTISRELLNYILYYT
jgi:hypothetical protein